MPISIYQEIVHIIVANISVRLYLLIYNMFHQLTIVMKLSPSLQQPSTSFPDFHAQSCCTLYNLYNVSSRKQTLYEYVCDCSTTAHCKPVLRHKKIEPRYETVNCGFGLCGFRTISALLAGQFTDLITLPVFMSVIL